MIKKIFTPAVLVAALAAASPALADGDAAKGKKVFNKCKACHFVDKEKNKVGPHLVNIFSRAPASAKKFKYSKAMKAAEITWNDDNMSAYLEKPKKFLKGTKMAFPGLKKEADRKNVIAYMKETTAK